VVTQLAAHSQDTRSLQDQSTTLLRDVHAIKDLQASYACELKAIKDEQAVQLDALQAMKTDQVKLHDDVQTVIVNQERILGLLDPLSHRVAALVNFVHGRARSIATSSNISKQTLYPSSHTHIASPSAIPPTSVQGISTSTHSPQTSPLSARYPKKVKRGPSSVSSSSSSSIRHNPRVHPQPQSPTPLPTPPSPAREKAISPQARRRSSASCLSLQEDTASDDACAFLEPVALPSPTRPERLSEASRMRHYPPAPGVLTRHRLEYAGPRRRALPATASRVCTEPFPRIKLN
jgi:hypothetical protein